MEKGQFTRFGVRDPMVLRFAFSCKELRGCTRNGWLCVGNQMSKSADPACGDDFSGLVYSLGVSLLGVARLYVFQG